MKIAVTSIDGSWGSGPPPAKISGAVPLGSGFRDVLSAGSSIDGAISDTYRSGEGFGETDER